MRTGLTKEQLREIRRNYRAKQVEACQFQSDLPATEKQIDYMVDLGLVPEIARTLSRRQADDIIPILKENPKPSMRQRAWLLKLGMIPDDIDQLSRDEVDTVLEQLRAKRPEVTVDYINSGTFI